MALYGVFPSLGYKFTLSAQKNAVERIYIKYGNTERSEMYAIQGHTRNAIPIYTREGSLLKV